MSAPLRATLCVALLLAAAILARAPLPASTLLALLPAAVALRLVAPWLRAAGRDARDGTREPGDW